MADCTYMIPVGSVLHHISYITCHEDCRHRTCHANQKFSINSQVDGEESCWRTGRAPEGQGPRQRSAVRPQGTYSFLGYSHYYSSTVAAGKQGSNYCCCWAQLLWVVAVWLLCRSYLLSGGPGSLEPGRSPPVLMRWPGVFAHQHMC